MIEVEGKRETNPIERLLNKSRLGLSATRYFKYEIVTMDTKVRETIDIQHTKIPGVLLATIMLLDVEDNFALD